MIRKTTAVLFTLAVLVSLSACNTMRGIGQDVQKAGQAVEDASKK